jgi:hypothetical protein
VSTFTRTDVVDALAKGSPLGDFARLSGRG